MKNSNKKVKRLSKQNHDNMNKKVTLSINAEVYKSFQDFCEENDLMLSKRVERLMKKEMGPLENIR